MVKTRWQFVMSSLIFIVATFIIFTNNMTDLLLKFSYPLDINIVAWLGIALSILWWIFLFAKGKRF